MSIPGMFAGIAAVEPAAAFCAACLASRASDHMTTATIATTATASPSRIAAADANGFALRQLRPRRSALRADCVFHRFFLDQVSDGTLGALRRPLFGVKPESLPPLPVRRPGRARVVAVRQSDVEPNVRDLRAERISASSSLVPQRLGRVDA
jgi:hypothetical protein